MDEDFPKKTVIGMVLVFVAAIVIIVLNAWHRGDLTLFGG